MLDFSFEDGEKKKKDNKHKRTGYSDQNVEGMNSGNAIHFILLMPTSPHECIEGLFCFRIFCMIDFFVRLYTI